MLRISQRELKGFFGEGENTTGAESHEED